MKTFLILLLVAPCFATGPKYVGTNTDTKIFQEFQNVYQDIRNPSINVGTASTMTITNAVISSATISSATITNLNGTRVPTIPFHILQVVPYSNAVTSSTTGTPFVPTNLTGTITPTSASSKVLILVSGTLQQATSNKISYASLFRNTTDLSGGGGFCNNFSATGGELITGCSMTVSDSPATTSSVTYTVYEKTDAAGTAVWNTIGSQTSTMILIEYQ